MANRPDLSDYIDVAARIGEFREKYPDGSLQPADPSQPYRVETIGEDTFVIVVAAAYRSPDDPRPGIGMAAEIYPGRTPYTKGSELMNAETSAWGRAIVAALAADTRRVASAEEVRNRSADREQPAEERSTARPPDPTQVVTFNDFAARIESAPDQDTLTTIGRLVKDASIGGRITRVQMDALVRLGGKRRAALDLSAQPAPEEAA